MANDHIIGTSVPRKEGREKVTGQAQYVDDMVLPNMLPCPSILRSGFAPPSANLAKTAI